jgi:hypothetical protein
MVMAMVMAEQSCLVYESSTQPDVAGMMKILLLLLDVLLPEISGLPQLLANDFKLRPEHFCRRI